MVIINRLLFTMMLLIHATMIYCASDNDADAAHQISIHIKGLPKYTKIKEAPAIKIAKSIVRCTAGMLVFLGGLGDVAIGTHIFLHTGDTRHLFCAVGLFVVGLYAMKKGWDWMSDKFKWRDFAKLVAVAAVGHMITIIPDLPAHIIVPEVRFLYL